jgi:hypothetical protein
MMARHLKYTFTAIVAVRPKASVSETIGTHRLQRLRSNNTNRDDKNNEAFREPESDLGLHFISVRTQIVDRELLHARVDLYVKHRDIYAAFMPQTAIRQVMLLTDMPHLLSFYAQKQKTLLIYLRVTTVICPRRLHRSYLRLFLLNFYAARLSIVSSLGVHAVQTCNLLCNQILGGATIKTLPALVHAFVPPWVVLPKEIMWLADINIPENCFDRNLSDRTSRSRNFEAALVSLLFIVTTIFSPGADLTRQRVSSQKCKLVFNLSVFGSLWKRRVIMHIGLRQSAPLLDAMGIKLSSYALEGGNALRYELQLVSDSACKQHVREAWKAHERDAQRNAQTRVDGAAHNVIGFERQRSSQLFRSRQAACFTFRIF